MRIYLAKLKDGRWLQRVDTRRAVPVAGDVNPTTWLKRVDEEFEAGRKSFISSVAEQFGVNPAAVEIVEREMDGWIYDAPYEALVRALASGTFEGRPVIQAPSNPAPDRKTSLRAKIARANSVEDIKSLLGDMVDE